MLTVVDCNVFNADHIIFEIDMSARIKGFHEPLSATSGTGYTSLCTVIQAFPLASVFWATGQEPIFTQTKIAFAQSNWGCLPISNLIRVFLVFCIVAVIWHRYVIDNNFVAWPINTADTLIPFWLAIVQALLAVSVLSEKIIWFSASIATLCALGIWAYYQMIDKMRSPHAKSLYIEHFTSYGYSKSMSRKIYKTATCYFIKSLSFMVAAFAVMIVISILCISNTLPEWLKLAVLCLFASAIIIRLFKTDLNTVFVLNNLYPAVSDKRRHKLRQQRVATERFLKRRMTRRPVSGP